MNFETIGFNFIKQLNSDKFMSEFKQYNYFTSNLNENIDITFLHFVDFDKRYDAIYYNAKLNNSNISYYGNAVLGKKELLNINRTIFAKNVIDDYVRFLGYSRQPSSPEVFIHFWQVTHSSYNIKIEPADLFNRNR